MASKSLVEIVDNIVKSSLKYEEKYNSFVEAFFEVLHKNETKVVLTDNDTGRQWTAYEVLDAIATLGAKFFEYGISNGDIVAIFCPNSDLHVIAMLSLWGIGAVYTGLIHKSPLRELKNVITKTNAKYLVGSKETVHICNEYISSNNAIKVCKAPIDNLPKYLRFSKQFFVIAEISDENVPSIHSMIKSKVGNKEKEKFFELMSKVKSTDLCKISFSSGTTGEPKMVKETQARYISYISLSSPEISIITDKDTSAILQPLPHAGGSMMLCLALLNRANVVVFSQFNSETFINDCVKHSITLVLLVPAYLNALNRTISEPRKSFCLKKVMTGGEFAPKFICEEYIAKFKPQYFSQAYGCTEAGWTTLVPVSEGIGNTSSAGVPFPGYLIKVVDPETGKILGANEKGEICIKGPQTSDGYLNNEEANRQSFDEQSFFKTGDIGYFDQRGYIHVIDRIKEIIKYNTQQVSPTELQNILLQHESVKEAAVVGIPDEIYGQLPKAFVVLKEQFKDKVKEEELLQFVNTQVMDFKKLRGGLSLMNELPKTSIGKIDRKSLKSMCNKTV